MDKSSFLYSKHLSKTNVALFLIAAMLVGFLCARAVGSVAIFLFTVNALRDVHPRRWFKNRWWLLGLIWVSMYAVSWFWTNSQPDWNDRLQVKIPFLLLPLAFGFLPRWTTRDVKIFTVILLGIIGAGICYSMSFFFTDTAALIDSYKHSKTLRTPVYDDHISFSSAVAVCIAWCIYSLDFWNSKAAKTVLIITALLFAAYLHIMAAKTGLVAFYLFLFAYTVYLFIKNKKKGLFAGAVIIIALVLAYKFVPTFRERVIYTVYTYQLYGQGERNGDYSDMGRLISYDISWRLIKEHPLIGVGAGDMMTAMGVGYDKWYKKVNPEQRLIPHNQFLTIALATGIPSMLAFTWWILAPMVYVKRNRNGFFFITIWLMLLVQLFTDPSLEVQFGVFVYLFFLLLQRFMLLHPVQETATQLN